LDQQSPFVDSEINVTTISIMNGLFSAIAVSALNYPSNDGLIRVLDGAVALRPKEGLSFQNTSPAFIQLFRPFLFTESIVPALHSVPVGSLGSQILDVGMHPDGGGVYYIEKVGAGAPILKEVDVATNATTVVGSGFPFKKIALSHNRRLYGWDGSKLSCITV